MLRPVAALFLSISWIAACGPGSGQEEGLLDFDGEDALSSAEAAILSPSARLWRQAGDTRRCGDWTLEEDFSTGRFNVHRHAVELFRTGRTTIRFERTAGTFEPAMLVATRQGRRLYSGRAGGAIGNFSVEVQSVGRGGDVAEIRIDTASDVDADLYLTSWSTLDAGFRTGLPRDSAYVVSVTHDCEAGSGPAEPPPASGGSWRALHDGLEQGGASIPRAGLSNPTLRRALGRTTEPYGAVVSVDGQAFVLGRVSHFGGPEDHGVTVNETGAITGERLRGLNTPLSPSPEDLRRRPGDFYYVAMRFDYTNVGVGFWRDARLLVTNPTGDRAVVVRPVDWGPNTSTRRIVDVSPQVMIDLGVDTDDDVRVAFARAASPLGAVH